MNRSELPLDIKLMTAATHALAVVLLLMALSAAAVWVSRWSLWQVRAIAVVGEVDHQSAVALRAQLASPLRKHVASGVLGADLGAIQQLFESVPWVRNAWVQRDLPNRLRVTLEEHRAVAWWGPAGTGLLVNDQGETFEAVPDEGDGLPELIGPTERVADIWALYQGLQAALVPVGMGVVRLELTERGAWQAALDNGAQMSLGRGEPEDLLARAHRFANTLGQLTHRYPGALQSVDLRYPNGYAVRVRGVTTVHATGAPGTSPTQ